MRELIKCVFVVLAMCCVQVAMAQTQELAIECSWGKISATLVEPEGGSDTAVIIIAGSGATDRDGNSLSAGLRTYCYAMLSDAMVARGVAVLRYDKRGVGQSAIPAADVPNLVFEDYIDDAEEVVRCLRDRGFKRVVLAGHSEGGLIALVAAKRGNVVIDGVVLLCATGYPIDSILLTQLGNQLIPKHIYLMYKADGIIKRLKSGERVTAEEIPQELLGLFHPVVQPFLISEMQYDPAEIIAECQMPILIVSAGRDVQISLANGEALAKAQPNAEHCTFEKMCHVLKDASNNDRIDQMLSVYSSANTPLTEGLATTVVEFINNIK